ncbi:nitroreductase family protein [Vallitalea okinawensis]|uniref:hypothetical protein n=1 Tax=Vallitalea okinawensis TaxID=2078660 RepID=UPI000CFCB064|nr:hypothetical protein [Vallitalea okinawensis]
MNDIIEVFKNLKTTRKTEFNNDHIEEELVDKIKDCILRTSNASNRQSYSIIELDREQIKELGFRGDRVLIYCVDFYRLKLCAEELEQDFNSEYFMQFVTGLIDISLLVQSTVLAAQSLGIDTLVTNEVYHKKIDRLFNTLKLPKFFVFPMIAVCMGYTNKSKTVKGRLNKDNIIFRGTYKSFTKKDIKGIIEEVDDKKKRIGLIDTWDDKGYEHYYEWFFDKWSKSIGNEQESVELVNELRKHKMI